MSASDQSVINAVTLSPPLGFGQRGAVMPIPLNISPLEKGFSLNGAEEFDPVCVRTALLFFDRIDCPENNCLSIGVSGPEGLQFWQGLQNSMAMASGLMDATLFEKSVAAAFTLLNRRDEGRWSFVRPNQNHSIPDNLLGGMHGFKISLENALPVPDRIVPYEDVLSFKERRGAELQSLRHHIELLAIDATKEGSGDLYKSIVFEKFIKSLDDYYKIAYEENFFKRLVTLQIKFNWDRFFSNIAGAVGLSALFPNLGILPILQAAGSSLSFESSVGLGQMSKTPSPFEYVVQAGREI